MKLRCYIPQDAEIVHNWYFDDHYEAFFRHNTMTGSWSELVNYPEWTNNVVRMITDDKGNVIGMGIVYGIYQKSNSACFGLLIDKKYHLTKIGRNACVFWCEHMFNRMNFRKLSAELILDAHGYLVEPFKRIGFKEEGIQRAHSFYKGKWRDEIRVSCLQEEFKPFYREVEWPEDLVKIHDRSNSLAKVQIPA